MHDMPPHQHTRRPICRRPMHFRGILLPRQTLINDLHSIHTQNVFHSMGSPEHPQPHGINPSNAPCLDNLLSTVTWLANAPLCPVSGTVGETTLCKQQQLILTTYINKQLEQANGGRGNYLR
jgi:hypothetical protein